MRLAIDASNIRAGGGWTHLKELLAAAEPYKYGFEKVIVWGNSRVNELDSRPWLEIREVRHLDGSFVRRLLWILFRLPTVISRDCDMVFSPGGILNIRSIPYVSMSQNMLVFDRLERKRFGLSFARLRYKLLNYLQKRSFKDAAGVIFLTEYARDFILDQLGFQPPSVVVAHGISSAFRDFPRAQKSVDSYSTESPYKILYVSIVNLYKHQWKVVRAISKLRSEFPVELHLVGSAYGPALRKLHQELDLIEGDKSFVKYHGLVSFESIHRFYKSSDLFLFASTCEAFSIITIEAMSTGLPIASSHYGPMPELLQNGAMYFDPTSSTSIENAVRQMLLDRELRQRLAGRSHKLSQNFSWQSCAHQTFEFLKSSAINQNNGDRSM